MSNNILVLLDEALHMDRHLKLSVKPKGRHIVYKQSYNIILLIIYFEKNTLVSSLIMQKVFYFEDVLNRNMFTKQFVYVHVKRQNPIIISMNNL